MKDNIIILYINCSKYPFIDWIIARKKQYETRNRDTLKQLIGKRVFIAETGKKNRPVIRCSAVISESITIDNVYEYESFRPVTMIPCGSGYDWKDTTKKKVLYRLTSIKQVKPFPVPDDIIRHGRVWAETT